MIPSDVEELVVRDIVTDRLHVAIRVHGGTPILHDACVFAGDREYMADFPAGMKDEDLCPRCYGGGRG